MFGRAKNPTEKLGHALSALEATAEAVREASIELREEEIDLRIQLAAVKDAADRGDVVSTNLKQLLGL